MREKFFKRVLCYLERHPSKLFARFQIQILLLATARAFEKKGQCILFSKDCLNVYSRFTKDCMKGYPADQKRLYRVAFKLGRKIRKIVGFTKSEDLNRLVFLLYRNIGITMSGNIPGELLISKCYFSNVYTAKQCSQISAMDMGIIAGVCGEGILMFTERITEGCDHCMAKFEMASGGRNW